MKRSARDRAALEQIDALYAQVPIVRCTGKCAEACGPIVLTDLEARRLQARTHQKPRTIPLTRTDGSPSERCVYLSDAGRCRVYAERPLICRIYGVVKMLSCPWGCTPERWLSDLDFVALAQALERVAGTTSLCRTHPAGCEVIPGFSSVQPTRTPADIDADAERTRGLRAIHGGRISAVVTTRGESR